MVSFALGVLLYYHLEIKFTDTYSEDPEFLLLDKDGWPKYLSNVSDKILLAMDG